LLHAAFQNAIPGEPTVMIRFHPERIEFISKKIIQKQAGNLMPGLCKDQLI
jgi:hypothetical protein